MTEPDLTALAPPAPKTVIALAALLHVSRRRISKWRKSEGAPVGLDLPDWSTWLKHTGRTLMLARIDPGGATLAGPTPETAAAAQTTAAPPSADDGLPKLQPLPTNATAADEERYWKTSRYREQTLVARGERQRQDRELIHADEVCRLLVAMATAQLDCVGDGPWLAIRPLLDGIPESLRRSQRAALSQWNVDLRARLAVVVKDHMRRVAHPVIASTT